jgi:GMP synthase (glutamine-hydrolysing)
MTLRALVVQNDCDKSLGRIADALVAADVELDVRMSSEELPDVGAYEGLITLPGLADPDDDTPSIQRVLAITTSALDQGVPVLGICLGGQLLVKVLGGETYRSRAELGFHDVVTTKAAADDPLLAGMPARFSVFHAHAYAFRPPTGATTLLENDVCVQACRMGDAWAFQCHPEPTLEWVAALARGIRGTPDSIDPRTAAFFRSNNIDPDPLERAAHETNDTAELLTNGIGRGFAARMHAYQSQRLLSS